jgi:LysM domain
MSTLSISRTPESSDVDARFDALVRYVPAQRRPDTDFETVFDLDYGQPLDTPEASLAPVRQLRRTLPEPVQPAPRTVRLTRRGRIVLVLGFLAIALALMIPFGGWAAASLTGGSPEPVRVVEVHPGDTLYGIAGDLAKPGHIREMVHRIQELNSLPGGQITEGQKLAVPRG